MTFSMATDGYPTLHQPWNHWHPLHVQGGYMAPHWQSGSSNSGSCMYGVSSDYRNEKPPLTQLQELASVFPSPVETESSNDADPNFLPESRYRSRDPDRDSGFGSDVKACDREHDAGYSSDRPQDCDSVFVPERSDSGFGTAFPIKEEIDTFPGEGGDSGCASDLSHQLPREMNCDADSGCADLDTPSALPGFHQAFGSTEIGRFSRNDFFTNPSPPQVIEPVVETPRPKAARKPRTPRAKPHRKDSADSPNPAVPIPEGPPYSPRVCPPPYTPCPPRYPYPDYSYMRPYPPCEIPSYLQSPFPSFAPVDCGQTWHDPRWPPYQPPYQQSYQQQHQWTSANVYPFMRLDY